MIYLDHGATSFPKPPAVVQAAQRAMLQCANPGRGGHRYAMTASKVLYDCRKEAADMFDCGEEQVVFTANCTHSLNVAIHSLIRPGSKVVISGFEHNAVTRPLQAKGVEMIVAGKKLFDWDDTLTQFENGLRQGASTAVFTHCSNVFGYILPVEQMAKLCQSYRVPFIIDAAQSAGVLPVKLRQLGASYIAMPGHKGLLGPMGTGILLCNDIPKPLLYGGTGSLSESYLMPDYLPDVAEAGTMNVSAIAGLLAGMQYIKRRGMNNIAQNEGRLTQLCAKKLENMGYRVYRGEHQSGTVSFVGNTDCEEIGHKLAQQNIAVRAGLHCAPLAHKSAGTFDTGTVRISVGYDTHQRDILTFLKVLKNVDFTG